MRDTGLNPSTSPVSFALLEHDGLMTFRLAEAFGPIAARQVSIVTDADRITRNSELSQAASGALILEARLRIARDAVPAALLEDLVRGPQLFGALVVQYGIGVRFSNRQIYCVAASAPGAAPRWGRRQSMVLTSTGRALCEVDELLVEEWRLAAIAGR